jgi:hypothetical protein
MEDVMPISLRMLFLTFACVVAVASSRPALAQDVTTAAKVPANGSNNVWAGMNQVMGGVSASLPTGARGPKGLYAVVQLEHAINLASGVTGGIGICATTPPPGIDIQTYLQNYFGLLLENPAVSGIVLMAQWCRVSTVDPDSGATNTGLAYIDYAINAIDAWNATTSGTQKTLQLVVTPGFNSPPWLFDQLTSCDGLFLVPTLSASPPPPPVSPTCGYTKLFYETENGANTQTKLPLPWNPTYKAKWGSFLRTLKTHLDAIANPNDFVAIAVAGPTSSSAEISLPNNDNQGTSLLQVPSPPPGYATIGGGVSATTAWNTLITQGYGTTNAPNYINSDRAFIEEWTAAIDLFGATFSGVTLTVVTGRGLPDFTANVLADSPLLQPPPAFVADCENSTMKPPTQNPMDCAAETAILAYFAGPPVGGPNSKATEEDNLKGTGILWSPLSGSGVKWLAQVTSGGMTTMPGNPATPGSQTVVSQMLGGLQLAKTAWQHPDYEGCQVLSGCTGTKPEQAIWNVLTAFFQGTAVGSSYGQTTGTNGTVTLANAPINYLEVWDGDILYAAGYGNCFDPSNPALAQQLMNTPPSMASSLSCHTAVKDMPTWPLSNGMTAQKMLTTANQQIYLQTAEYVIVPPVCSCPLYVPRGAFKGDNVCVVKTEASQAQSDTRNYSYAIDYTNYDLAKSLQVPYGTCGAGYVWRQAYLGDYVCVSSSQATLVASDNAQFASRNATCPRPGARGSM